MADKFTRITSGDGQIWRTDSAGTNHSIEELEDNIDEKMLAYIGSDLTSANHGGDTTETVIGQVTISANTVNSNLVIFSSLRMNLSGGTNLAGTFKIRVGTNGTTADTQVGGDYVLVCQDVAERPGGSLNVVAIEGTNFTASNTNYVSVTFTGSVNGGAITTGYCDTLIVLGA